MFNSELYPTSETESEVERMKKMTIEQQMATNGGWGANWRTGVWYAGEVAGIGAVIFGTGGLGALALGIGCGLNALRSMFR